MRMLTMIVALGWSAANAAPVELAYQGRLLDTEGTPITASSSVTMTISWNAGTASWSETHTNVAVADGYFAVVLGSVQNLDSSVFENEGVTVSVSVNNGALGSPAPLMWAPRAGHARTAGRIVADALNDASSALASCNAIKVADSTAETGVYYLDPDGVGTAYTPFKAHCEMDLQGGGWTLVQAVDPTDGHSARFSNTTFWTENVEYGHINDPFDGDFKSSAAWSVPGGELLVTMNNVGSHGQTRAWRHWTTVNTGVWDQRFDSAANTAITSSLIAGDTTVSPYEPLLMNGTQLVVNGLFNPNNDRSRIRANTYPVLGDDNQPGVGVMMNQGVGPDQYRYGDIELWVNSSANLWTTNPGLGTYKVLGNDHGCGISCGANSRGVNVPSPDVWTYRFYVR